jgi:hypothetical protein
LSFPEISNPKNPLLFDPTIDEKRTKAKHNDIQGRCFEGEKIKYLGDQSFKLLDSQNNQNHHDD